MRYRPLPGTDLSLSVIGFGAWAIGGEFWGDDVDDQRSIGAIKAALDEGINWFDTAPIYGRGHSDTLLRTVLGGRRDIHIATKVGAIFTGGHAHSHLTPQVITQDLHDSLERLGTECIDLLQVHWPCELNTPLEETFSTLATLKAQGKFRYLGVCNYDAESLNTICQITPLVSLQTGYNLLRREVEGPLRTTCETHNLGILAYEPLCRGLLTGKFNYLPSFPPSDLRHHDERFQGRRFTHARQLCAHLNQVAQKVGTSTASLALGWVSSRPQVVAAIAGAKNAEQVRQNASAARLLSNTKLWKVVDRVAALHGGTPR